MSPSGTGQPQGSRLLPAPVAGNSCDGASLQTWQTRLDRQKKPGRNGTGIGTPLSAPAELLTAPMAGDFGADKAVGPVRPSGAKRQTGLPDMIIHRLVGQGGQAGTAEAGEGRLPPTPDTGCSPNGHGRRGGRPGNGHQSGHGLDVAATSLTPRAGVTGRPELSREGTVRAGDPPLGARPGVSRAAARRAGDVRAAPAVGRVRRVDDGPLSRGEMSDF